MLRDPEAKVSILRDGTVLFNPVAVSKFMLEDGQMIAVFFSVPARCLFFRHLPKGAAGVCLRKNAKGAVVAKQAADFLRRFRLLTRTKTYSASWDAVRESIVVPLR